MPLLFLLWWLESREGAHEVELEPPSCREIKPKRIGQLWFWEREYGCESRAMGFVCCRPLNRVGMNRSRVQGANKRARAR